MIPGEQKKSDKVRNSKGKQSSEPIVPGRRSSEGIGEDHKMDLEETNSAAFTSAVGFLCSRLGRLCAQDTY